MAAGRKEYELQMKLTAALGSNFNSSFQGAMSTVKKLQGTLQNVRKVQGDISAYQKTKEAINGALKKVAEYETKNDTLQNELAQTIAKEKELQAALKKTEKETGNESEEYKKLQNQLQATRNEKSKLKSQIKDNERALDAASNKAKEHSKNLLEMNKSLRAAGINTLQLTQENEKLEKAYNRVKKAQEDYARVNTAIEQNKAAISATRTELVKTTGVITAAGAAFYKGFITPAAELQEQMSTVRALISTSSTDIEGDMAKLQAIAQKMGATTKFTAVEAGKALEYMGMAGWNAVQMESGLPGIMNLAAASGEDLGTVSDIVTDALTAFGMKAEDAGHFADVLAQAASNANTDVGMMGATFQKVAPVAGALGYSVEDMSLGISLMANASIKAETAGTQLKGALANLAKPTDQMQAYMDKYNISLTKTDGTMKTFEEVIENLRTGLGGLAKDEQVAAASAIFGKQNFAGMLAIINASEEDFTKVSNAVNNAAGAAERMANTKLDNLNGDITLAKSAWDGFATSIGNLFLPNMRTAVKSITDFINKANEFVQNNPEAVKQIAKVVAGLAALKVGGLAGKLGFLEMKGGVLEVVKVFTGFRAKIAENAAAAATGGNSFKMLSGIFGGVFGKAIPLIAIISALSMVLLQLSGEDISEFVEPLKSAFEQLKPVLNDAIMQLQQLGKDLLPYIINVAKALAPLLGQMVTTILPVIIALIQSLLPIVVELIKTVLPPILEIITTLLPILMTLLQALTPIIQVLANVFSHVLGAAIKAIKPILEALMGVLKGVIDFVTGVFTGDWGKAWEGVKGIFSGIWNALAGIIKIPIGLLKIIIWDSLIVPIGNFFISLWEKIKAPFVAAFEWFDSTVTQPIISVFAPIVQKIGEIFSKIWEIITTLFGVLANWFNDNVITPIVNYFKPIIEIIGGVFQSVWNSITGVFSIVKEWFSAKFNEAWEAIKNVFAPVGSFFKGVWDTIVSLFSVIGTSVGDAISGAFKNVVNTIIGFAEGIINGFINAINKAIGLINEIPGVNIELIETLSVPKLEKGSDFTPDTFIAGDVNGKGGELVTGARGRKVFTAAETSEIFKNISAAKSISNIGDVLNAAKNAIAERIQGNAPQITQAPTTSGDQTKFEIHYNPTIYIEGDKPADLEEKLEQNNEKLLQKFKEFLEQEEEKKRRTTYA